ncbi:MAG: hypothetical protein RR137_07480, partial [Odoribacter sp.]
WKEVVPMIDFGCDIYLHDIGPSYDVNDVSSILKGIIACNQKTKEILGRKMKVLVRPNGNNKYITAGRQYDDVAFMTSENNTDIGAPLNVTFNNDVELKKATQYRRYTEPTPAVSQLMPYIDEKALAGTYAWVHDFSHAPADFQYILDLFTNINDKYGKDGSDCVWFASMDEVYEYNYIRKHCTVEKNISNNVLTLKFSVHSSDLPNEMQFHRDFSILVSGISMKKGTIVDTGDNIYGLSYSQKGENLLVNVNCNKSLIDKANRYTGIYEKEKTVSKKEDALYFINQLKDKLKTTYLNRIK